MPENGELVNDINENLKLIQKRGGLTFGTDAYLLSAYVRPSRAAKAVDLGSGTGVIPLLCASGGKARVIYAVEIQPDHAELIEKNALQNGLGDRIIPVCADLRDVKSSDIGGEADIVVSNPPYMRADSGKPNAREAKNTARHEVNGGIFDFCAAASRLLKTGGSFYVVYRPDRMCDLFCAMRESGVEPKRVTVVFADSESVPSMLLCEGKKGASPSLRFEPPLIIYEHPDKTPRVYTRRMAKIYEHCSFYD